MGIKLNKEQLSGFVSQQEIEAILPEIQKAHDALENKTGKGSDYTGWVDLPGKIDSSLLSELEALSLEVQSNSDCIISIGIGRFLFRNSCND